MKIFTPRDLVPLLQPLRGLGPRVALAVFAGLMLSGCESPDQYAARMDAAQRYQAQPQHYGSQPAYGNPGGYGYGGSAPAYPQPSRSWDDDDDDDDDYRRHDDDDDHDHRYDTSVYQGPPPGYGGYQY